jgi:hypothetical protein
MTDPFMVAEQRTCSGGTTSAHNAPLAQVYTNGDQDEQA